LGQQAGDSNFSKTPGVVSWRLDFFGYPCRNHATNGTTYDLHGA
jgi:hypothetical protein